MAPHFLVGECSRRIRGVRRIHFGIDVGLYQKVETSDYTKYTGRYSIDGTRLTGVYDDGESWGSGYDFELTNDGNTLTMTARTEPAETSVYSRTTIPDDVRDARTSRAGSSPEMKRML